MQVNGLQKGERGDLYLYHSFYQASLYDFVWIRANWLSRRRIHMQKLVYNYLRVQRDIVTLPVIKNISLIKCSQIK